LSFPFEQNDFIIFFVPLEDWTWEIVI
jgi:hypothetical protein